MVAVARGPSLQTGGGGLVVTRLEVMPSVHASMGSLFPSKFAGTKPAAQQAGGAGGGGTKRPRSGSRASGNNPRAMGTNPAALRRRAQTSAQPGSAGPGRGTSWANPAWRKAEIARRSQYGGNAKPASGASAAPQKSATELAAARAQLGPEQCAVLDAATRGTNVFFTGNAGTGKSHLLRTLVDQLRHGGSHQSDSVFVTASTGIAAANVGGTTIHSFAGIGFGDEPAAKLISKLGKQPRGRWKACSVLILDEISMLDGQVSERFPVSGGPVSCTAIHHTLPTHGMAGDMRSHGDTLARGGSFSTSLTPSLARCALARPSPSAASSW